MLYIICFDIVADKPRANVSRLLEGYGRRVQGSVFECWLDRRKLQKLQQRLRPYIDIECDKVRIYPLCGKDVKDIYWQGRGGAPEEEPHYYWV